MDTNMRIVLTFEILYEGIGREPLIPMKILTSHTDGLAL